MDQRTQPCLWMSAGLVSYKLCDRDFDCDRCPFDAAIRGEVMPALPPIDRMDRNDLGGARVAALCFPEDRLYASGHTWVQEAAGAAVRIGLDAFAVALLGSIHRVQARAEAASADLDDGATLCEVDLDVGRLPVTTPVAGRPRIWNRALEEDGTPLMRSPYDEGWIAELDLTAPDALTRLLPSAAALERSRLDLRRFRRRAALFLFEGADDLGPTLADGGEILTDLRAILGAPRYLELVADLVR
ncbi:MAG: hypothetical protein PVG07_13345 [Acidobacteriota bacterium]|jgi:glycine cleavage system H protein